ncbi:hypothetical protein [Leptospira dzoumogneensis]|uniref:Uncharacterized protein n=1 Tax=Leptospira dzoumogneensis TaxID=2484904 RepID=A0A4Z1AF80_9LEPT|nr:hypothetical protein [Leptospira dzoumogneensis]TGM95602.1 hypothetical protein EHR06_18640 [Leptospira dzoumogneensis]
MNTDSTIAIITFFAILLVFMIKEIILIYRNIRKIRQDRHLIRVEKTREYFSNIRESLLHLMKNETVHPDNNLFQVIYSVSTMIMRRPDQYAELSDYLVVSFINTKVEEKQKSNKAEIPKELRSLLFKTAEGLYKIIIEYSAILRVLFQISNTLKQITPLEFLSPVFKQIREKIFEQEVKSNPKIENINIARKELKTLSLAA